MNNILNKFITKYIFEQIDYTREVSCLNLKFLTWY